MKKINSIIILLFFLIGCEITLVSPPEPISYDDGDSVVLAVRPMNNNYACMVTALGMWLQFYDDMGYLLMDNFKDIVSDQHVTYYVMPKDTKGNLLPDSSLLENPPQNCLADFLKTSWYNEGNFHGATLSWNIVSGLQEYLKYKGDKYTLMYDWVKGYLDYIRLIDQGYPVYLSVSTPNNNHSILGIGYVKSDSTYLSYNSFGDLKKYKWENEKDWKLNMTVILQIMNK